VERLKPEIKNYYRRVCKDLDEAKEKGPEEEADGSKTDVDGTELFLDLAKSYGNILLGIPSYDLWPSFADVRASNRHLALLNHLNTAVHRTTASTSTLVCAGHISVIKGFDNLKSASTSEPVVVHWDTQTNWQGRRIFLPQTPNLVSTRLAWEDTGKVIE
jgi:hypothetical protein